MKKALCVLAVFLMTGMVFAAWTGGSDGIGNGGSQAVKATLNLKTGGENITKSIVVGFASAPVTTFDDVTGDITTDQGLTINDDDETASLEDVYVYWQIKSPDALQISLKWDEKLTGTGGKELAWTVSTTPGSGSDNGTASTGSGSLILDRSTAKIEADEFNYATVGSQKVNISVKDVYSNGIVDYSGTLTLTISGEQQG